ncbi:MAG: hypothetical protein KAS32_07740 [Candidatus Peribacteraceae bacterium]|nr:hypothetical protein [Candidatus Peribacteraceae bacterium]
MIDYLKVEIVPAHFAETEVKELRIKVKEYGKDCFEKRQLITPDELVSFFEQIWDCAGKEILKALKDKAETSSPVPVGASQRP